MAAPGVYIEECASLSLSVRSAATAVAVFVGNFKQKVDPPSSTKNTSDRGIAIANWLDFIARFEGPTTAKVALDNVTERWKAEQKALITEGDEEAKDAAVDELLGVESATTFNKRPAFILSKEVYAIKDGAEPVVAINYGAFALQHYFSNGGTGCYLLPLDGKDVLTTLGQEIQKYPDISLLVCPEPTAQLTNPTKAEVYTELGKLLGKNLGYFLLADGEKPLSTEKAQTAVYHPNLVTTLKPSLPVAGDISFEDTEGKLKNLTLAKMTGLAFDKLRQAVMAQVDTALKTFRTTTPQIILPPSAAVAGAYARTDQERGAWKAPANVSLNGVERVETVVTDAEQGSMNERGINVIRTFTGQGTMIWGARTLEVTSDHWRYIPVRRLFNAVERDIKRAMQFAMFETNNAPTWESVKSALENYLYSLWRQGALMGTNEKEAYFVQIGKGMTMTEDDIKQGKMIVKVGMAAVRPAEFIILQFTQNVA